MQGWIKKHRRMMVHWLYEEERVFSRYEAFDYLLMMVNHQDNKTMMDGKLVSVERGQMITSVRKLCDRWKWSNTKVVQFLDALENDGMITKISDTKKTVITIENYGKYQGSDDDETTQKRYQNDTETIQKHTNKNVKNEKNVKEEKILYLDHVRMTEKEHTSLLEIMTEKERDDYMERFNVWITGQSETVRKKRDAYLSIRKWYKDAKEKLSNPSIHQPVQNYSYSAKDREAELLHKAIQNSKNAQVSMIDFGPRTD